MAGNANSGRRPQPARLKMLRGNPRKVAFGPDLEPPAGAVEKPTTLSPGAAQIWDELAPVCRYMGTLTAGDLRPFATLCELQATLHQASAQKSAEGFAPFVVSQDFNGADVVKIHAAIKLERETATAIRPYYALFGLEPVSRARIHIRKATDEPHEKWAALK